jgi:DNA-binding FrmR family transcriptional regulator
MSHAANPDLLNRLKRAQGHLGKIIEMVAEGRDGLQIAQQMQAVIAAIDKTKTLLVTDHIEHHLEEVIGPLPQAMRGELAKLGELAKYL